MGSIEKWVDRAVVVNVLLVLLALILAAQKRAIGSWVAAFAPLYLQDALLMFMLSKYFRGSPDPKTHKALRTLTFVAKLAFDVVTPLHADGVVPGPTSAALVPAYVLCATLFTITVSSLVAEV